MPELIVRESLWKELTRVGKKVGKKPEALAEHAMQDYLQRMADEELLARSARAARKTRFKIGDSERIIRAYRKEKGLSAMAAKTNRIPVVLDTNVLVRNFKSRSKNSPNRRVVRLWLLERRLQLIVSDEIVEEYLGIFADVLGMDAESLDAWTHRFDQDKRVTAVRLGRRYTDSRDPDDNRAEFLVTNDLDLLDLPEQVTKTYLFGIMRPHRFLARMEEEF